MYAGMTWERGHLAIGFTDEPERHARECRARFVYPDRVFGYPADHTLRALEECGARVREIEDRAEPLDDWYLDVVAAAAAPRGVWSD